MARIAGVSTQKDEKGNITHVTIDIKKHKEIIAPVLEKLGVVQKTKFQLEAEQCIDLEELRTSMYRKIDEFWKK